MWNCWALSLKSCCDEEFWCRNRWTGEITLTSECSPTPSGCDDPTCVDLLKTARKAYAKLLAAMGDPTQVSFEGRSQSNFRSGVELERITTEIRRLEMECGEELQMQCGCIGGCYKCVPRRRRPYAARLGMKRRS